jgi:hypothetical protein
MQTPVNAVQAGPVLPNASRDPSHSTRPGALKGVTLFGLIFMPIFYVLIRRLAGSFVAVTQSR